MIMASSGSKKKGCTSVLVTGATGFIGKYLVKCLVKQGLQVHVATRRPVDYSSLSAIHTIKSIDGNTDWQAALSGIDCIINLAGRAHRRASIQKQEIELFRQVNTEGVRALARQASAGGVKHFVHISSIAVNGPNTNGRNPFSPQDHPAPNTIYGLTKLQAELELREATLDGRSMSVDLLRCPTVIGPEARGNLAILASALRHHIPLPLASIRNRRMFLGIDDLCQFIILRLNRHLRGVSCFTLATGDGVSTPDLIRKIGDAMGTDAVLFPSWPSLLRQPLTLFGFGDYADALMCDLMIDVSAALQVGWQPALSLDSAIAEAYQRQ